MESRIATGLSSITIDVEITDNRYPTMVRLPANLYTNTMVIFLEDGLIVLERLADRLFSYPSVLAITIDQPVPCFDKNGVGNNNIQRFYLNDVLDDVVIYRPQEKGIYEMCAIPNMADFAIQIMTPAGTPFQLYAGNQFGEESYVFTYGNNSGKALAPRMHFKVNLIKE